MEVLVVKNKRRLKTRIDLFVNFGRGEAFVQRFGVAYEECKRKVPRLFPKF